MNMNFRFDIPTKLLFGSGELNRLSELPLPGSKALIVITSGKSTRKNGYLARVEKQLDKAGIAHTVYDGVSANPTLQNVREGAQLARSEGCDLVVGLGGGSAMDCAKGIALAAANEDDLWDYTWSKTGKGRQFENKPLPVIAITTTAGTGSEIDPWCRFCSAFTCLNRRTKELICSLLVLVPVLRRLKTAVSFFRRARIKWLICWSAARLSA